MNLILMGVSDNYILAFLRLKEPTLNDIYVHETHMHFTLNPCDKNFNSKLYLKYVMKKLKPCILL